MAASTAPARRFGSLGQWTFVVFMVLLMALFVTLGTWQVQRLAEKEALIARVEARFNETPAAFPPADTWSSLDPEALDYRPFGASGTFRHDLTVLVFDNLTDANGQFSGPGYWVMAPLETRDGGVLWVNRGFVPESQAAAFANGGLATEGEITIQGIARRPQQANPFTPGPEVAKRREWVRDPERLDLFLPEGMGPAAPVTLDQVAGAPGSLPQGGETQIVFPNRHLEYAGTWFGFALVTLVMLGYWIWRQRHPGNLAERDNGN
ncbi:SURF1 family protein [Pelagibacterium xiamenense]|uniref:SURF1 family protein n=1 Tax=Pelagibacterium xiamenense TaxID=2901140 RepID=UPI001E622597|nr:SURF1 family protein [Pelagibacterium xiamenense]MCD7059246.1 SURF1 family protein [Pelagibacterium xiamenense]